MVHAIYAGSFDPITNGHIWVIKQAIKMFDKVYVAVGINADKRSTFTAEERIEMIKDVFRNEPKVEIISFYDEFLVNVCRQKSIDVVVRGIRNVKDFEYEQQIQYVNDKINPNVQTVYLVPPNEFAGLSSSLVKSLVGLSEWQFVVQGLVPKSNMSYIMNKACGNKSAEDFVNKFYWNCHVNPEPMASLQVNKFRELYNHSSRYYHTMQHINEMMDEYSKNFNGHWDFSQALPWAILFHDYIYSATSTLNEENSVVAWKVFAKENNLSEFLIEEVKDLIMATKTHQSGTEMQNLMVDLDFMILGKDVNRFNEYEKQIRFEYAFAPDEAYKKGRIDFVKGVLARNSIFLTEEFREKYETQARTNLNMLLKALENK